MAKQNKDKDAGQKLIARALKERRRFRRVHIAVAGRVYIPASQEEAICIVEDISPGDASILCELREEPTGRAVIYLDSLGRFEGPIVRSRPGGYIMTFTCSLQKREKLAELLMLEMNRSLLSDADFRGSDRVEAAAGMFTHFTRTSGEQTRCEVIDMSLSGVSVRTDVKPPIGEHILMGHRAARVARHHYEGIGVEFLGAAADGSTEYQTSAPLAAAKARAVAAARR